jgi:trans-2,3-dihydro-3-hydroxyanthranilate isomerase
MTAYRFYTADVFTDRAFGGNPLAVFPDARALSGAHMQEIAREFNLSETVFLLPPQGARHTCRARMRHCEGGAGFTPAPSVMTQP